ncbi:hypothetical protein M0R72_10925 [Candidatus Pacearchaeota archaeon]|jgi:hypothetical protein|nr:hypothetical protein [Candidatus Pacearchaeota archaeon]
MAMLAARLPLFFAMLFAFVTMKSLVWPFVLVAPLSIFFLVFSVLDARSRIHEYIRLVHLFRNGKTLLAVARSRKSMCQRHACLSAAAVVGKKNEVLAEFQRWGYRWYHFLPDGFTVKTFFTGRFWNTFWVKAHSAR